MNLFQANFHSPIGFYKIVSHDRAIVSVQYISQMVETDYHSSQNEVLRSAIQQIQEYFKGIRKQFTIPFVVTGTPLMQKIYKTLVQVPYGSTIKYGELAKKVGIDHGGRFAGNAMARNPLPILIPCHRVIYADGSIGSYSAGGEKIKKWLIDWESAHTGMEER